MASSSPKIWRNSKWFGGYSEDRHIGIDGSFWRGTGCEIRRFPRRVQLAKALETQTGAPTGAVNASVVTVYGDTISATGYGEGSTNNYGKIYRRAKGTSTWNLVYTFSTPANYPVHSMVVYNGYLYIASRAYLSRILVSDTKTDTTWTTVTENYKTFTNGSNTSHPMFEAFNNLYLGDNNQVAMLSSAGTWTAAKLVLDTSDEICRITFVGNMLRFWCRKIFDASNAYQRDEGACVLWNGTSDAYNERVVLDGMFQTCATMGGQDYFIAGFYPALYVMSGLTPIRLKVIPTNSGSIENDSILRQCRFFPNAMVAHRGLLYFGTPLNNVDIEAGVWSYGRLNENYPFSMTLEYPLTAGTTEYVTSISVGDDTLLNIGWTKDGANTLYHEQWSAYQTTGEIETRVFDGGNPWQVKDTILLALGIYPLASGEKIEVYIRKDLESAYGSAILTAQYSDTEDRSKTYKYLSLPFTGKEFTTAQFKIKLTAGSSAATTPKVFDFSVLFEDTKNP